MRLLRRRTPTPQVTAEQFAAELRAGRRGHEHDPDYLATLEGLKEPPNRQARMQPREDETVPRHALYLLGTLVRFADHVGKPIDRWFLTAGATAYCVGVAEFAANPEKDLRDPHFGPHIYAMVRAERKTGSPMRVRHEELLASWLATNLGLRPLENMGASMGRWRARRHAKLFPGRAPEGSGADG